MALRRTRIVCVSDTHNCAASIKLPRGDVLIHAGDLTNQGSHSELSRAVSWLEAADFEAKIVIAGNHDVTLDTRFYHEHGPVFHNQRPESSANCRALLTGSPSITFLEHESTKIRLKSPDGPHTEFSVFGSPFSPRRGLWAFGYDADSQPPPSLWDDITPGTDIVVTHTPPRTHRDLSDKGRVAGCEALRRALWRVRPRLAVCGHVHEGRGAEHVVWASNEDEAFAEKLTRAWDDPGAGTNKLSLMDLTSGSHDTSAKMEDETCIVNAAVMKSKHPHVGGKQFHRPIVVDVDLPVWADG
ncbi:hypothetical protein CDD80_6046 [Ophiocordyceps camponoti-rufipedis]|uniref:Calcineurin-like phosphoesterase domain-containing protein n=1 Tax=Ophiocordyceps camponoti-rufipedis TaxID=2004952 RepID=A0A2C5YS98_9HYPO|nr:hypothetical protein CDD80_6046 [Ophiocordyceps camponoti-rufipedis]